MTTTADRALLCELLAERIKDTDHGAAKIKANIEMGFAIVDPWTGKSVSNEELQAQLPGMLAAWEASNSQCRRLIEELKTA